MGDEGGEIEKGGEVGEEKKEDEQTLAEEEGTIYSMIYE